MFYINLKFWLRRKLQQQRQQLNSNTNTQVLTDFVFNGRIVSVYSGRSHGPPALNNNHKKFNKLRQHCQGLSKIPSHEAARSIATTPGQDPHQEQVNHSQFPIAAFFQFFLTVNWYSALKPLGRGIQRDYLAQEGLQKFPNIVSSPSASSLRRICPSNTPNLNPPLPVRIGRELVGGELTFLLISYLSLSTGLPILAQFLRLKNAWDCTIFLKYWSFFTSNCGSDETKSINQKWFD